MAAPVFQAIGAQAESQAGITVAWPAHATDDIGILAVNSAFGEAVTTPSGWTLIGFVEEDQAASSGCRLTVFWKRAASASEADVSIADTGDHTLGRILTARGADATANPFDQTASLGQAEGTDTVYTFASVTTSGADRLIVLIASNPRDVNSTTGYASWTNGNLDALTERGDDGSALGGGGSIGLATGTKLAAGAIGSSTVTVSLATPRYPVVGFTLALQESAASGITAVVDQTLSNTTISAAAELLIEADLSQTLALTALSAASELLIEATVNQTLDLTTLGATAEVDIAASVAQTLGLTSITAAAELLIQAAVNQTLDATTIEATAFTEGIEASVNLTLDETVLSAAATAIQHSPLNPPTFDVDRFSPPVQYREAGWKLLVDASAGLEPEMIGVYRFGDRIFVEVDPYE